VTQFSALTVDLDALIILDENQRGISVTEFEKKRPGLHGR
jgi:hypothetical protein